MAACSVCLSTYRNGKARTLPAASRSPRTGCLPTVPRPAIESDTLPRRGIFEGGNCWGEAGLTPRPPLHHVERGSRADLTPGPFSPMRRGGNGLAPLWSPRAAGGRAQRAVPLRLGRYLFVGIGIYGM